MAPGRTVPRRGSGPDMTRADSFASVVKDEEAPRRRPANISVSGSTVRKWSILDWSEDAWNAANGTHPDGFGRWNQPAFQGRGATYPCLGHVRGLRGHVCTHSECRAGRPLSVNTIC